MISAAPEYTVPENERVLQARSGQRARSAQRWAQQRAQHHPLHEVALLATRVLPGSAVSRGLVRLSRSLDDWARRHSAQD